MYPLDLQMTEGWEAASLMPESGPMHDMVLDCMISPLAYFSDDMALEPLAGPSAGFKAGLWPSLCRLSEGALGVGMACVASLLAPAAEALNSLPYHLVSLLGTAPASAPTQVL
jgi:hypothetical protein